MIATSSNPQPAEHSPSTARTATRKRRSLLFVAAGASAISLAAFAYFYSRGMTNVYSDGTARVNIARKVVDHPDSSIWQRYIQIGSPWLPLQTVLMLPLVGSDRLWRSEAAGSIVSMLSFVIASVAIYLTAVNLYRNQGDQYKKVLPVIAAGVFALNPSVLFMQATPMSELPFMATLAAAAYAFQRWWLHQTTGRLVAAGLVMSLAALARYEAWPVAAFAILFVPVLDSGGLVGKAKSTLCFMTLALIGPAYWLWHNWAIWGDALAFLSGPHSARSIYVQQQAKLGFAKVFVGNAALDSALMLLAVAVCAGPLLMVLAASGLLMSIKAGRRNLSDFAPILLLTIPFLFHVLSLYRGEIQVFPLSAFGLLNVRYGLPHLLAISLLSPAAVMVFSRMRPSRRVAIVCAIVAAQYGLMLSDGPSQLAVYQEGFRNGVNSRPARELGRLSTYTSAHPPQPVILMYTGALGPVVLRGGLRFSEIIHEGTLRWHQVNDSIPADVSTIITQGEDPLDRRLRASEGLSRDLSEHFREKFSAGSIRVFERVPIGQPSADVEQ